MSWNKLPNELRHLIWSFVVYEGINADQGPENETGRVWRRNRSDLTNCALVNRQWQEVFEQALFKNLFLTEGTVRSLKKITPRQKKLVRYIWLKVSIESSPCRPCNPTWHEDGIIDWPHSKEAGLRILYFLSLLRSWRRAELGTTDGLTIEISCCSPQDGAHFFRNDIFLDSSPFADTAALEHNRPTLDDLDHNIAQGKRGAPLDTKTLIQLFHPDIEIPGPDEADPITGTVEVATRLVIRRQTRRQLDPFLMQRIIEALPELTAITYEPWRDWRASEQDLKFFELLDCLPSGVQDLKIFEDFNEEYNHIMKERFDSGDFMEKPRDYRTHYPELAEALARRSQTLRSLAASYMVDAVDFFFLAENDEQMRWEKLKSLQLSSITLGLLDDPNVDIASMTNEVLLLAGRAALRMPQLEELDIWYAQRSVLFSFSYRSGSNRPMIQWKGSRPFQLNDDVIHVWSEAADLHSDGRYTLTVLPGELIKKSVIDSHATAINILGIGENILHPVSLQQISHETGRYFFGLECTKELRRLALDRTPPRPTLDPRDRRIAGHDGWGFFLMDDAEIE